MSNSQSNMLKSIKRMLDAFEANGIVYCHWKSNEHLAEALSGDTDLDVIFMPEQRSLLDVVLNQCGLKRFRSMPLMQYNAIEDYIGLDEETAKIWHLHTHYRMTLGEKHLKGYTITPWGKYILDHRTLDDIGIYVCAPEIELVLLVSRNALKFRLRDFGKRIEKDELVEYQWLLCRVNKESLHQNAIDMLGENGANILLPLCEGDLKKKSQLRPLYRYLRKQLGIFTGYSHWGSRWTRTKRELFWLVGGLKRRLSWNSSKPYRRISPSGGAAVVFLGCDGAGKSTSLDYVKKEFGKKIDVKTVYLGSGDGSSSLLRKPMKLVARKVGGKGLGHQVEKEYQEKKRVSLKSRLYSIAKIMWAVTLASEKKTKLRDMTKARNNGMLVLVDRYPQTAIPGYSDGPLLTKYLEKRGLKKSIAKWEYRIYESAAQNMPDLSLKLMVPTEVAIARKPEMTVEEIEHKKEAVRAINCALHSVEIDTSCSKEESFSRIMSEIWQII